MSKPKIPNQKRAYSELNKRLAKYAMLINNIYEELNKEVAKIVSSTNYSGTENIPFSFSDFPQTKHRVDTLVSQFVDNISAVIFRGTSEEWKNSNEAQELLANKALKLYNAIVDKRKYKDFYQTNSEALQAFQNRKDRGLNLSDKLWRQSNAYKIELEDAISCAIQKGTSAVTLSKRISKYLIDFPSLKKDYKDLFGYATKAHNCHYQSVRLATSEINMAYRKAESLRWKQMDFVVGYEIKLSGNHTCNGKPFHDICDELKGKYPKDFEWTGWHPLCRCYKIPILKTEEEFWEWDEDMEHPSPSVNEVKDVPIELKRWLGENAERIETAQKRGTLPYFLRDNSRYLD